MARSTNKGSEVRDKPLDHADRERFAGELDRNFSVIAPAGVGKTRAIVDRVVAIATSPTHSAVLPTLAVVTYTNKAADEMQRRARNRLLAVSGGATLMGDFNRAFFGTIHSFCMSLLRTHGHYLGLPGRIEMVEERNEGAIWLEFFRNFNLTAADAGLTDAQLAKCFRHLPAQDVLGLGRVMPGSPYTAYRPGRHAIGDCPEPNVDALLGFVGGGRAKPASIAEGKTLAGRWREDCRRGIPFVPLPEFTKGGADFLELAAETFEPMRRWLQKCALAVARCVAARYSAHRLASGQLTYQDQIALVLALLEHPEAGASLRAAGYRVILDEAQDTDPDQFRVLLGLARPPDDAGGDWLDNPATRLRAGHFCMVGDPQQSIYGGRADLGFYEDVRKRLLEEDTASEIKLHITFRCSGRVTALANALCPQMLNGKDGQVEYVNLRPRAGAPDGQVIRLPAGGTSSDVEGMKVDEATEVEAGELARWMKRSGPERLGAADWSQVAILCARKRWIGPIDNALRQAGLPVQNVSSRDVRGDDPAFAWFAALAACVADPANGFELTGVLRDVFGLSDLGLYDFCAGDGSRLRIDRATTQPGIVADTLRLLKTARDEALRLPLADAARRLAETTNLAQRLSAIEEDESPTAAEETLDTLFSRAARAEAEGLSFTEWAEELRADFDRGAAEPPAALNAIHLVTCHGAKGLEWDAVVIPLLFRPIHFVGSECPYVHVDRRKGSSTVIWDKNSLDEQETGRIKRTNLQEAKRLLYVAMTRARHTLVMVDDSALFPKSADSFAALLDACGTSEWKGLPTDAEAGGARREAAPEQVPPPAPAKVDAKTLQKACAAAGSFRRRVLPHKLATLHAGPDPESDAELDPEWDLGGRDTGMRYGSWWHSVMERLDWKDARSWDKSFERELTSCPLPARAQADWERFKRSDTAARLASSSIIVRTELPFLAPEGGHACIEGVMDVAAFDREHGTWLVVDWKTDAAAAAGDEAIAAGYAPQIAQYMRTLSQITGVKEVTGGIYATATGRFIALSASATPPATGPAEPDPKASSAGTSPASKPRRARRV